MRTALRYLFTDGDCMDRRNPASSRLDASLSEIAEDPAGPLAGLAAALIVDGRVVHETVHGRARIAPPAPASPDPAADRPLTPDTLVRAASMSKPFTACCALALAERGKFDLDRDLSDYLGFPFRDRDYSNVPITAAHLLSHASNLRDDEFYNLPYPVSLKELIAPDGALYDPKRRFAPAVNHGSRPRPGSWYEYCNLNYGVLATALEAAAGKRFDKLAREVFLDPGLFEASYNVLDLPDGAFGRIGTIYRCLNGEGEATPAGTWTAQVDDYRDKRPETSCRIVDGARAEILARYEPGTNGTLFSPQGGLRVSLRGLERFALLMIGDGVVDGIRLLREESVRRMRTPRWKWNPDEPNGIMEDDAVHATGAGLLLLSPTPKGPRMWGHRANAYGLRGGFMFDAASRNGFVYYYNGVSREPDKAREENIQGAIMDALASLG